MSRRESCVWHPMPEDVRRSSVQSRRASLAAGRRKSMHSGNQQPDWEVEAPATPPAADDREAPAAAAVVAAPAAAATAAAAAPHSEEEYPVEEEAAAAAPAEEEAAYPPAEDVQEESYKSEPPANEEEEEAPVTQEEVDEELRKEQELQAAVASGEMDAKAVPMQKTRHTLRFRGARWPEVMETKEAELKAAFMQDIFDSAQVKEKDAERLRIKYTDCMVIMFVLIHAKGLKKRQKQVHQTFADYKFPNVCALYPADASDASEY